jgi:hypothetical protein
MINMQLGIIQPGQNKLHRRRLLPNICAGSSLKEARYFKGFFENNKVAGII